MNPRHPVFIISKGRADTRLTAKVLEKMSVPYRIVIEPQEYTEYAAVIDPKKILQLPFSNLNQGSIPARNWVWDFSISEGATSHWILDDNIKEFYRLHRNSETPVRTGAIFRAAEDFVERYSNIAISGFQYYMFVPRKVKVPPLFINARVYSCILIRNDIKSTGGEPYRWRGRYNEDTDLSLRVLKDGWCTVLFYAFLAQKMPTMTMKGGNTEELYKMAEDASDGRFQMAKALQDQHPDIVKIAWKWGRWQHQVDYSGFRDNKLTFKPGVEIPEEPNNYGMVLQNDEEL